jgi:hypothetical protein
MKVEKIPRHRVDDLEPSADAIVDFCSSEEPHFAFVVLEIMLGDCDQMLDHVQDADLGNRMS